MREAPDTETIERRLRVARDAVEQITASRDRIEHELAGLISLASDVSETRLQTGLVAAACEIAGASFAMIFTEEGPEREPELSALAGVRVDDFEAVPSMDDLPVPRPRADRPATTRIADALEPDPMDADGWAHGVALKQRGRVRSWLVTELAGESGPPHGYLVIGDVRPHRFSPRHERLVTAIGEQFGRVLDNARRHAQRERVAAALERALLPAVLPEIPGADVAALYRPAGSASVVGGDFYDVFAVADDAWSILVGDVSGTGPEAAALTGIARYTVRAVAADMMRPSEVLTELNGALVRGRVAERFCTALFAHVRCAPDRLDISIASAGHPSPLLLRADGTVRCAVGRTGTLLGVFESVEMHDESVTLMPGDSLVAYSDGVIEARDRDRRLFGEEGLATLLASCTGRSADGIVRRVDRAVRDHVGNEHGDDVVLLALRAVGN